MSLLFVYVQWHSTASSLPPLPESGPTDEVALQEVGNTASLSPIPSMHTSNAEEAKEEANEVQKDDSPAAKPAAKRRRLNLSESSSSHSKDADLKDDGDSGSSPPARDAALTVTPLASRPPPTLSKTLNFGGSPI